MWVCHFVLIDLFYLLTCSVMESIIQPIPFTHYYVPDAVPGNEQNRQDYYVVKLNSRRKPIKK